jgi:hypothetical protein
MARILVIMQYVVDNRYEDACALGVDRTADTTDNVK